jgi:Streptomycin adenylyltransferase.
MRLGRNRTLGSVWRWRSLFLCCELFRSYSKAAGANLGYPYPDYDEAVTGYIERIYSSYR